MKTQTVESMRYGRIERFVDWVLGFFVRWNFWFTILEPSYFRDRFGFHSRGDPYVYAMDKLLDQISGRPLTNLGRVLVHISTRKAMKNRKMREEYAAKYPEVREISIDAPVFIVGFPRTGTTALQNLIAAHPDMYAPRFWELLNPFPTYWPRRFDRLWRKARTWMVLRLAYALAPEQSDIHEVRWDSFEEDWHLMAQQFAVMNQDWQFEVPEFGDWLMETDQTWAYEELKLNYQILLHQNPDAKRLVVKCPDHLCFLEEIFEVFPDAHVVWTHRDPAKVIPSYSSLTSLLRRSMFGDAKPKNIGPYILARFMGAVESAMEFESKSESLNRLHMIRFSDFKDRQFFVTLKLYGKIGLKGSDCIREKQSEMEGRKDKRGAHKYNATTFDLDEDRIRSMFQWYMKRYNIPTE